MPHIVILLIGKTHAKSKMEYQRNLILVSGVKPIEEGI
jgi:hypothetical protein